MVALLHAGRSLLVHLGRRLLLSLVLLALLRLLSLLLLDLLLLSLLLDLLLLLLLSLLLHRNLLHLSDGLLSTGRRLGTASASALRGSGTSRELAWRRSSGTAEVHGVLAVRCLVQASAVANVYFVVLGRGTSLGLEWSSLRTSGRATLHLIGLRQRRRGRSRRRESGRLAGGGRHATRLH